MAKIKLKQYEEAIEDYKMAKKINKQDTTILNSLSECQILAGEYESAKISAQEAFDIGQTKTEKVTSLFLKILAMIMLEEDTESEIQRYNNLLQDTTVEECSFDFEDIRDWLDDIDIEQNKKESINQRMEPLCKLQNE